MTKRILNWNTIPDKTAFDNLRREAVGQTTGRELFQKAYDVHDKQQEAVALKKSQEPGLKNSLLKALVGRTPIKVLRSFQNVTETLGGIAKSETRDAIDDAFYNTVRSNVDPTATATANASFQETLEVIPAGVELVFKHLEKSMGQLIFKGSDGEEYAIYKNPQVMFQDKWAENPGYYGLLFNTDLGEN